MKVTVVGSGYVGLSNAILIAQNHDVVVLDIVADRVAKINSRQSPFIDDELQTYLTQVPLSLHATLDKAEAYRDAKAKGVPVINDVDEFKRSADVIICNRIAPEVADVIEKVYTRDLFGKD